MPNQPVLALENLSVSYRTEAGWLDSVRHVSLHIQPMEKYGLVGESGSGKTTLALAIMRYLASNGQVRSGRVLFNGVDLLTLPEAELRRVWGGGIAMVYQNPSTALNPSLRIGDQIAEVIQAHLGLSRSEACQRAIEALEAVRVGDPADAARRYPHQLSGGMVQRAVIAMAMASNPQLLLMDEPTTALDVTTEAVVLDLIDNLARQHNSAVLYITHNLGVVARLCDRVGVMYAGEMAEQAPVRDLFHQPLHPYTAALIGCVPRISADKHSVELSTIPGFIPRPDQLPQGCIYAPRCPLAEHACRVARPPMVEVAPGRFTACRRWEVVHTLETRPSAPEAVRPAPSARRETLLVADEVKKHFDTGGFRLARLFGRGTPPVKAVDGVSVEVPQGLTLGLVGESGSGKTTFGRCLVGLLEATDGKVCLDGEQQPPSLARRSRAALQKMQMVFQNPDASLNPRMTVGEIIRRPLASLRGITGAAAGQRVAELLASVNLPADYANRLPEELSGGEKQRVAIARAFAADPELVICDEPISALDVSVQGALLNLLNDLQLSRGVSYLFISHDLAAVRHISDYIAVMYLGLLWEVGKADEVFTPPYHPYTEALLSAIPVPDPDARQERIRLEGAVPSPMYPPPGCRFHPRCPRKLGEICEREQPPWRQVTPTHRICCHREPDDLRYLQSSGAPSAANGGER